MVDDLRDRPAQTLHAWFSGSEMPLAVRALLRVFVTGRGHRVARRWGQILFLARLSSKTVTDVQETRSNAPG
jgi:hypothetical protein